MPTEVQILPCPRGRYATKSAGVTQLVESQPSKLLVAGSSPVSRSCNEAADVAQMVEHHLGKVEVTGSIPVISSLRGVAQLVEQRSPKP